MSARTTLMLLGLLLALGLTAVVVEGPWSPDRARQHAAVFPGLVAGEVSAIRVERSGQELLLSREGTGWVLGASREPANSAAVEQLLADLVAVQVSAVVSKNAQKQSAYESDAEHGSSVRLEGPAGKTLHSFIVGKRGPDFESSYLRREGATEVLLVSRNLHDGFARPTASWREPPQKDQQPAGASSAESGGK